jgi:hypothetical protein
VLLTCTLLGLATMHSLGHGGAHTATMSTGHAAMSAGQAVAAVAMSAAVENCPDGHCRQVPGTGHGRHDDIPAWSVCLAVLAGLGITALLAWLMLAAGTGSRAGPPAGPFRSAASRPPPRPRLGLRVATVSVLRM